MFEKWFLYVYLFAHLMRLRMCLVRMIHNHEVPGSIPGLATKETICHKPRKWGFFVDIMGVSVVTSFLFRKFVIVNCFYFYLLCNTIFVYLLEKCLKKYLHGQIK